MNSMIRFHFLSPGTLSNRGKLKHYLLSVFKKEKKTLLELNIIFCSDTYLLDLNLQYLKHDFYTDILSFNLSAIGEPITGEIYISIDRVRENASNIGSSFKEELHRVIFHGILHLCGYKDKTSIEVHLMRSMENKLLTSYFESSPGIN
jgi:probable rRNA maturation factor